MRLAALALAVSACAASHAPPGPDAGPDAAAPVPASGYFCFDGRLRVEVFVNSDGSITGTCSHDGSPEGVGYLTEGRPVVGQGDIGPATNWTCATDGYRYTLSGLLDVPTHNWYPPLVQSEAVPITDWGYSGEPLSRRICEAWEGTPPPRVVRAARYQSEFRDVSGVSDPLDFYMELEWLDDGGPPTGTCKVGTVRETTHEGVGHYIERPTPTVVAWECLAMANGGRRAYWRFSASWGSEFDYFGPPLVEQQGGADPVSFTMPRDNCELLPEDWP